MPRWDERMDVIVETVEANLALKAWHKRWERRVLYGPICVSAILGMTLRRWPLIVDAAATFSTIAIGWAILSVVHGRKQKVLDAEARLRGGSIYE